MARKKCTYENCNTIPTYGLVKSTPLHCKKHIQGNEKDVVNKQCEKCGNKQSTYGIEKRKPRWCKTCKPEEAFDVKHKMCESETCSTRPTFGLNKAVRCLLHRNNNDIPFGYRCCETKNCKLVPSFSDSINNIALRCSKHKLDNWVDVSHLSVECIHENCYRQSSFGNTEGKPEFCSEHKLDTMIDLTHSRCIYDNCDIQATFGELKGKKIYCTKHKDNNHLSLNSMAHGELHRAIYTVLCSVKSKDKKKDRQFDLTLDFLFDLYEKQNKECYYCKNVLNVKNCNKKNLDQISVDRKDSSLGHTKPNCVLCCLFCNYSKSTSSVEYFDLYLKFIKNPELEYNFESQDKTLDWAQPLINRIKYANKETNITKKWLKEQLIKQNNRCEYTKMPMIISCEDRFIFKPSIERKNCKLSYTTDNCVLICLGTNYGRSDFPLEDYKKYITLLKQK